MTRKNMTKPTKIKTIPPLTVYASAKLPRKEIVAYHQQIQRATPILSAHYYKKKNSLLKSTIPKDQVQHRKNTLRPLEEEDVMRGFAREMRRELSLYLKKQTQPNAPLEIILSTLSCLWVNGELSSDILHQFQTSSMKFLVFNTYYYGGENIAILISFQKRTYLVVCEGTFTEHFDALSVSQRTFHHDESYKLGDMSFQMNRPIATALPRIPFHKILFATPLSPDIPTVKPKNPSLILEPI